jgi:phage N-6-adenine-methyltransferase
MSSSNHTSRTKATDRISSVHFSSKTDLWATSQSFFDALNDEFAFTLDVCALAINAKCHRYFSPADDGLTQQWQGVCWMNPPYGREIRHWVRKAFESAAEGATVVCLLPARTDTTWWHTWVVWADEVRFIRGRLKFGNSRNCAPFPSADVVFRGTLEEVPGGSTQ